MESIVIWSLALLSVASGFYLPGLAPTKFCSEEDKTKYAMDCQVLSSSLIIARYKYFVQSLVYVHVNKLDSVVHILPYEYTRLFTAISSSIIIIMVVITVLISAKLQTTAVTVIQ